MAPFTAGEFFGVFAAYNQAVWPAQPLLVLAALATVWLASRGDGTSGRAVSAILGLLWLWMGAVYHLAFFSRINPAAIGFGALFLFQGGLLLWDGIVRGRLTFGVGRDAPAVAGGLFALYALLLYPVLGHLLGHTWPANPTFGAPCPTTIFTFAILLWAAGPVPGRLLVVPFLWSLVGLSAAVSFGVLEDLGLLVAGVVGTGLIVRRNRMLRKGTVAVAVPVPSGG